MTTIIERRDTAAIWTSTNPILASGQWGVETDTGKGKIGDGVTAWTSLGYSAFRFSTFIAGFLDDADASTARATLGLGTIATQAASAVAITGGSVAGITDLAVADGGTGASTAANARTNLGLGTAAVLAVAEVFAQPQTVNAQTGTAYTLVAGDVGKLVTLSNASAITLTLPQDSDATFAVGTYVDLYQLGAGQVTTVAGTGATLRVSGITAKARAQYSRMGVQKVSANTWSLFGDLAAS